MKEVTGKVTRKGQVTIPIAFRKLRKIREGSKVTFRDAPDGLVLVPLPNLEDLAGADARRVTYQDAVATLNRMRSRDRY